MRQVVAVLILTLSLGACGRDRYTVIERLNDSEFWVKVVLLHDGHKFYTTCNNYKAAGNYKPADASKISHCGLRVGQTVQCKFFPNRESGYDLICGNELVNGELTTSGGNELLLVEKEDRTGTLNYESIFPFFIPIAAFLVSFASLFVARSSLKVARSSLKRTEQVAERDRREWRQRKWFDLYFKVDEAYNLFDHFQTQYGGSPLPFDTEKQVEEWNNLMRHMREAHAMAVVFPNNSATDELFACSKFKNPAEALSKEHLKKLLDAINSLREKALIEKSVLE